MQVIHSYKLSPLKDEQDLELPLDAKILSAQSLGGGPILWVQQGLEKQPLVRRRFLLVGTGCDVDDTNLQYLGTVQAGIFVWHVFERRGPRS